MDKKILIPSIIIPAAMATGIAVYFLSMPAWLLTERIESTEHNVVKLPDSALQESPKLREALETADERYNPGLPGTNSFKLANSEGSKILEIIREHGASADSSNRFRIENDGRYYLVNVIFQYEPPALA